MSNLDVMAEVGIATYEHKKKTPVSSIIERNFLLDRMGEKGRIKSDIGGGTQITVPLTLGENQSIQNIFGGQKINIGASNTAAQLQMGWSEKVMVVSITRRESNINRSKEALYSFMEQKMDAAHTTATNRMGMEVYSDGSGYESLFGLPSFITPGGGGNYGNVPVSQWTKWRSKSRKLSAGYTADVLEDEIIAGIIDATDGVEKPDMYLCSAKQWKMLEKNQRAKIRHTNVAYMKEDKAQASFTSISIGDVDVHWDSNSLFGMDLDMGFLVCTDHIWLNEHPEGKWKFDKGTRPIDSLQNVLLAPWMGAMFTDKRRCHNLIYV